VLTSEMLLADQYLQVVHRRGQQGLPLKRVYRNMRRRGLFLKAYAKIYANAGATTVGTDAQDTVQGMSLARIDAIIAQLREGTYHWKPSRRIYIPKRNGAQRPLSVPNWSDKLVQEVMRMILEAYYEPQFRDSSHGFRPNRSCHTALRTIKRTWTGTKWFIEGDIKGCFDNLEHKVIDTLLSRTIHDNRFLRLVRDMLRAGYMDDWQYHRTYSGAPQGGIISPILANIVLHELDKYVEDILIPRYTRGERRERNREYDRLWVAKQKAKQNEDRERYQALTRQLRQLPRHDPYDPHFRRLRYARYADDFLLGFTGPKEEALAIKAELGDFLQQIGLTLSAEKTYVTHAREQAAKFLGYEITTAWDDAKLSLCRGYKIRALNGTIQLRVPREVHTKWMRRYTRKGKPCHIGGYIELSDFEIVQTFGAQLRGLVNYYALADNIAKGLGYVRWVCMESARKTLAAKHKIRQPSRTYRRYYQDGIHPNEWRHIQVTIERDGKPPLVAKCGETPLRTRKTAYSKDTVPLRVIAGTKSELLTRLLKNECELCGQTADLEAHHVNKLKNLRKKWQGKRQKPQWVQFMIARRRKTVVVCRTCHQQITSGTYDGPKVG
jgi:group II intron reverse transcriptase/maturase